MSVSIYDIAKRAGVSPSTVSRALENHPRIGSTTRQRIQELAREMDYIPSTVAKGLAVNRTWIIGMVLPTIADPFMGRVVEGVEQVAIEAGFNVFTSTSQNDRQREIAVMKTLQKRRVDGIIVITSHLLDQYSRFFDSGKIPTVIINEQKPGETMHFVTVDDAHGARLAVEHLLALGHRCIGYVGVTNRPQSNQYRLQGYQDALKAFDIPLDSNLIFTSHTIKDHARTGEASLEPLLAAGATAIFCYNDVTALGLLAACYKRGVSVPNHLSVIGFDDIDMVAYTIPPLTTIRQPGFELGWQAMHMILKLLDGQEPKNHIVPVELVVRQTTAHFLPDKHR
ncbi:MAG: LacI family DNA-binding transcriptional regulator [Ktedonobacteraceae bacterium]